MIIVSIWNSINETRNGWHYYICYANPSEFSPISDNYNYNHIIRRGGLLFVLKKSSEPLRSRTNNELDFPY